MSSKPAKKSPPTTTTTTPGSAAASSIATAIAALGNTNPLSGITAAGTGSGATTNPGVPTKQGADPVTWANSTDTPFTGLPADAQQLLTTGANGSQTLTYDSAVTLLKLAASNRHVLVEIQNDLRSAGYITPSQKVAYGTLDKVTQEAWKTLVTTSINSNVSITQALSMNGSAPGYNSYMYALQQKYQSAIDASASASAPMLTLTDPNKVAQSFASAMESLGLGSPSAAQVDAFVGAFHNAEINATQDAYATQKSNYAGDAKSILGQEQTLQSGPPPAPTPTMVGPKPGQNGYGAAAPQPVVSPAAQAAYDAQMNQFRARLDQPGPTTVATKAMPNLDAEAMAAAKAQNPGAYYAQGASEMYGILQEMLNGSLQMPTSATPPSAQGMGGAVVTAPALAGM